TDPCRADGRRGFALNQDQEDGAGRADSRRRLNYGFYLPLGDRQRPMTIIRADDLVQSIADAVQFISFYHPADYVQHLAAAYEREQSPAARDAMAQILTNSRMCAEGRRPICQDTGVVNVFLRIGMNVRF